MIDDYIKFVHIKAASGYKYGCVGLQIWLHRVTNMTASGYEYDSVG